MSAKVIQFPNANERIAQMIDEIVDAKLTHDNPQVLDCLKVEMKTLVEKYFTGEDVPATLVLPPDLSDEQFNMIEKNFIQIFQQHNEQMLRQTNAMFLDLCLAKLNICELKHQPPEEPEEEV